MLDPATAAIISFVIAAMAGYASGYGTVRINNFLVILLGKAWSSGHAQRRYYLIAAYAAIAYFIAMANMFYPDHGYVVKALTVPLFLGLYALGILQAERRYKHAQEIMNRVIAAMYLSGQSPEPKKAIDDACRIAAGVLGAMPVSNAEILRILFMTFDSRTAVFFVSLGSGEIKLGRFIQLKPAEQMEYLRHWSENDYLFYAIQGIKSLVNFSYYSSPSAWKSAGIEYDGDFLRWSYLK